MALLQACLGLTHHLCAGQAVVQFAYGKLDKQDYAIKFFLSRKAFEAEEALYRHTTLGQFLPHVNASCPEAACSIRDPSGRPLPSCMVMERGEALDIWMERAQPDKYMAFSVRLHHVHLLYLQWFAEFFQLYFVRNKDNRLNKKTCQHLACADDSQFGRESLRPACQGMGA